MNQGASSSSSYQGTDRLLVGIILGVITFWLFAQTTLNIAPDMQRDLGLDPSVMNIAVAVTALFSGIFTVVLGGLADRIGRLRMMTIGFYLSVLGSALIATAPVGSFGTAFLMVGRALQGVSAACIMPASLALVKTYWDGAGRQRAVSLWSIGSWGGSGMCSLFGGLMTANFGWRYIFLVSIVVALVGLFLVRGTPESKAETSGSYKFDFAGVIAFMITMVALQIVVTQGNKLGWTSPLILGLIAVVIIVGSLFFRIESVSPHGFVDFKLFRNRTYAGATISNFLLNGVAGTLLVSLQLVQLGGNMTAQEAGTLTLGYAIAIIAFIRVGEKLLQRFGARKPMIWGCVITGVAILMLSPANVMLGTYKLMAMVAYALFGIGLAFYATPSTDAALSSLPSAQAGSGAGIYKMASSLGAAFGVAVSAAIFTALRANPESVAWLDGVITFYGRQDNLAVRQAAIIALMFNVFMVLVAILSIMLTVPKPVARKVR
ncbi:MFS transporter [Aromatoleum evansii]|uniref:MFS transporter n=1 Tax=Aromatoleum evansii TaxID=59406 RepID=A0ABZ1AN58_AROEV|nr:MFS transporter [Aromatoleum evansii]